MPAPDPSGGRCETVEPNTLLTTRPMALTRHLAGRSIQEVIVAIATRPSETAIREAGTAAMIRRGVAREILEDRWDGFVSRPNGQMAPKFLRLCRALNAAVAVVARYEDEDESPLERELLEMVHERIVQRVSEGGHFTLGALG